MLSGNKLTFLNSETNTAVEKEETCKEYVHFKTEITVRTRNNKINNRRRFQKTFLGANTVEWTLFTKMAFIA